MQCLPEIIFTVDVLRETKVSHFDYKILINPNIVQTFKLVSVCTVTSQIYIIIATHMQFLAAKSR